MKILLPLVLLLHFSSQAQLRWTNVDSAYGPLPSSVHIYFTEQPVDTGKFRAFYLVADLNDRKLAFTADTSKGRRLTPGEFFVRDGKPLAVVNTTFFSYETNSSLNLVVRKGKLVSYNRHDFPGRGKDTFTYRHVLPSAIGIDKKRKARVLWTFADTGMKKPYATYFYNARAERDSNARLTLPQAIEATTIVMPEFGGSSPSMRPWKVKTAVGGGPALLYEGKINITNNEELRFPGKAIIDKHPRTAMGITRDNRLIILMVEGRNPEAGGATLTQLAQIFLDLGCTEALNLDGGGSSCLLINGKETIRPSDKHQRGVPAVLELHWKK